MAGFFDKIVLLSRLATDRQGHQQVSPCRPWIGSGLVNHRRARSTATPNPRPASTSVNQCANRMTRVATRIVPPTQARFRSLEGSSVAADARAPTCKAWPDGNESADFPDKGTPRQ